MASARKKREKAERREEKRRREVEGLLREGKLLPVDDRKVVSRSVLPRIPEYYRDVEFVCRDCGKDEVWTARRQKVYYEELGGEIEGRPVRCALCRKLERERKAEVTRSMREGMRQMRGEAGGDGVGGTL
ncbi:zinc-ribbon domain containing protein [Sulfuriroseicoccus oceanibius]|uniref:Zinc-ribbon domain containing protein n=1 Tax=Sulfuriroseicoccus oceanibius TaxID=2707525 RepID=A0A6B3L9K4_9BACT|nr:zinc-ribbon domain containing protein [Sulfuriroseicoccus oceanibius]QQL43901.1 zinc-ribbon domain containing protein [Sulfuriroseicoccus oceanibius]